MQKGLTVFSTFATNLMQGLHGQKNKQPKK